MTELFNSSFGAMSMVSLKESPWLICRDIEKLYCINENVFNSIFKRFVLFITICACACFNHSVLLSYSKNCYLVYVKAYLLIWPIKKYNIFAGETSEEDETSDGWEEEDEAEPRVPLR